MWTAIIKFLKRVFSPSTKDSTTSPVSSETPSPVLIPSEEQPRTSSLRWQNKTWDDALIEAIRSESLHKIRPTDLPEFASSSTTDLTTFYAKILVEMAYWESKWKPTTTYTENFKDRFGKNVVSTGLFQISLESVNGVGAKIRNQEELLDPVKNIRAAVRTFTHYVSRDGRIAGKSQGKWLGAAKYWAVLRGTNEYTAQALAAIKHANQR